MLAAVCSLLALGPSHTLAAAPPTGPESELELSITLRFHGACGAAGTLVLREDGVEVDRYPVRWTEHEPLRIVLLGAVFLGSEASVELLGSEGRSLLVTRVPGGRTRADPYRLDADVDCSAVPYRLLLPDTASSGHTHGGSALAIGVLLLLAGLAVPSVAASPATSSRGPGRVRRHARRAP